MLIDANAVKVILETYKIAIQGILHVGAHECEEKGTYNSVWKVPDEKILWLDANPALTVANIRRGISNCYTAVLDETEHNTEFFVTNNGQSSSLLELGTHKSSYPSIVVSKTLKVRTQTLQQFFERQALNPAEFNVWNFDIQGSELNVFRGSEALLDYADLIYTEVNTAEVYKGCGLLKDLDTLLEKHGLTRIMTKMTDAQWGDAIYVRTSPRSSGSMTLAIPTYRRYDTFLSQYLPKYLQLPFVDQIVIADETGEDIDKILQQPWGSNPKFRFIRNPTRLGAYHNKLNLMQQCTTDWICLMDSDNEVLPQYFEALHAYWKTHGADPKGIYIPAHVESRNLGEASGRFPISHLAGHRVDKSTWNSFLSQHNTGYCLNLGNCVFHRESIATIPSSPPKDVMADCQVMNKALVEAGYTLVLVPNMTYYHIVHPGSLYLNTAHEQQQFQRVTDWRIPPF